ncbi:MAG TPA: hypothetical protein EYO84_09760 [Planctomycetes bacterium]|nr:hypothetical protein [Planctomycetota bacterium]
MYALSKNRFSVVTFTTMLVVNLLLLSIVSGCGSTPSGPDSTISVSPQETEVSDETYTRILQQGEIVGYLGEKTVTVIDGGTTTTTLQYNIYDIAFRILGTFDESGATYRFTRGNPEKLGNFTSEHSIRQVTGIEGILEFKEGLQ